MSTSGPLPQLSSSSTIVCGMRGLLRVLLGQERAIENARSACTALSRQRVEREEVELFLARHAGADAVRSA